MGRMATGRTSYSRHSMATGLSMSPFSLPRGLGFRRLRLRRAWRLRLARELGRAGRQCFAAQGGGPENPKVVPPAVALLEVSMLWSVPWAHHVILMEKVKDLPARRWYMEQTPASG